MRKKRVRIVCDGCGGDHGTETIVKGLMTAYSLSEARVHGDLWNDCGRAEDKRVILLEGAHAERIVS